MNYARNSAKKNRPIITSIYVARYRRAVLLWAYLREGKVPLRQLFHWLRKLKTDILHGDHLCRLINVTTICVQVINLSITIHRSANLSTFDNAIWKTIKRPKSIKNGKGNTFCQMIRMFWQEEKNRSKQVDAMLHGQCFVTDVSILAGRRGAY